MGKHVEFVEAGDFFIKEMDMRREGKIGKIELGLLNVYKHISRYGEDYKRPIISVIILIFLYPILIYLYFREFLALNNYIPSYYLEDLRDSAKSFFQIDNRYIIERLIGIVILGQLFIALKREFERKK